MEDLLDKKTVLLVEDELRLLESSAILLQMHFDVVKAATAAEALQAFEYRDIDCIVLDIYLPDMNGLELLKKMQETGMGKIPVITVSGGSDALFHEQLAQLGVRCHLHKPYDVDDLAGRINDLFRLKNKWQCRGQCWGVVEVNR